MLTAPKTNEYDPSYHSYINLVPEQDVAGVLIEQSEKLTQLLRSLTEGKWNYRYAMGKWSVKEVIGHLIDNEIIMNYRLLRISRGDTGLLPGYEQEDFIAASSYASYPSDDLIHYYQTVRQTTLGTFKGISSEQWLNQGYIDGKRVTARSVAFIIAGHEIHHIKILQDKYLRKT